MSKAEKAEARERAERKRDLEEKLFEEPDYILDREEKLVADWMQEMLQKELVRYLYVSFLFLYLS